MALNSLAQQIEDGAIDPVAAERHRQKERRVQSILMTFIVSLALYIVTQVGSLTTSMAVVKETVGNHDVQLAATYQAKDAKRDMAEIQGHMAATDTINTQQQVLIEQNDKRILLLEEDRKMDSLKIQKNTDNRTRRQ